MVCRAWTRSWLNLYLHLRLANLYLHLCLANQLVKWPIYLHHHSVTSLLFLFEPMLDHLQRRSYSTSPGNTASLDSSREEWVFTYFCQNYYLELPWLVLFLDPVRPHKIHLIHSLQTDSPIFWDIGAFPSHKGFLFSWIIPTRYLHSSLRDLNSNSTLRSVALLQALCSYSVFLWKEHDQSLTQGPATLQAAQGVEQPSFSYEYSHVSPGHVCLMV